MHSKSHPQLAQLDEGQRFNASGSLRMRTVPLQSMIRFAISFYVLLVCAHRTEEFFTGQFDQSSSGEVEEAGCRVNLI